MRFTLFVKAAGTLLLLPWSLLLSSSVVSDTWLQDLTRPGGDPDFLPSEEAFRAEVSRTSELHALKIMIEPGYYLYSDRLRVVQLPEKTNMPALSIVGTLEQKREPDLGDVKIYRNQVDLYWPNTSEDVVWQVTYQGCADAGLCYPPVRKQITPESVLP